MKRDKKGGLRGGSRTGEDKETEGRNRGGGGINRKETDHTEHLNP